MVQRKSNVQAQLSNAGIGQEAQATSFANIGLADTITAIGSSVAQAGIKISQMNQQFRQAVIDADNTAVYSNSINQATIDYQNRFQARINETVDDEGNPTFSTLQTDVADIGRDVLEEHLNSIESAEVRAKFQQNFESYTTNQQVQSIGVARNQQLSFINESINSNVSDFATLAGASSDQDRMFFNNQVNDILDSAVASGAMTPQQRFATADSYRKEVATAQVRNQINQDPILALETLKESPAQDLGLTELERLSLQNEAQTAANRLLNSEGNLLKEEEKYIKSQLSDFNKIINLGGQIPQESIDEISGLVEGTEFEQQFVDLMTKSQVINEFTMNSPITRAAILNELSGDTDLSLKELELRKQLGSIDNNLNSKRDNDVYSLGLEQGIIANPEPFNASENIQQQLSDRLSSIGFIENHYGKRTSGITKAEINGFKETYADAEHQVKLQMLGDVIGGLGPQAMHFFEELSLNGSPQVAAIGSLMLEGNTATAATILRGQDVLNNIDGILGDDFQLTEQSAVQDVLPFYPLPEQEGDIREMAKAIYAANTFEESDRSGRTNSNRWQAALAEVSNGGGINVNASNIEPPVNGMTSNQFKRWLRGIDASDINRAGGWRGFDDDTILRTLPNAKLQTFGRGQYAVFLTSGDGTPRPVMNDLGEPFILDYSVIEGFAQDAIAMQTPEEIAQKSFDSTTSIRTIR